MSEPWLAILGTVLKSVQGGGTNNDAVRHMIQDELRRSQSKENSEALQQMLSMVERRHAEQLDEKNREIDKFKTQVEFLSKQVHELNREKKTTDRTDKMKDLLTHLADLNVQNHQRPTHNRYQKQGSHSGGPLPWMDNPKGKGQFHQQGISPQNKFPNNNSYKNSFPNQNYQHNPDFQDKQKFQHDQNFQKNCHTSSSSQNFQHNPNLQQKQFVQQPQYVQQQQRGQQSNRYRGRGQKNASGGARGRSASVGRNEKQLQEEMKSAAYDKPSTSFHIQVTKVGAQQWVSTENISGQSNNLHRGRGNSRCRGRGRGRGHGDSQQVKPGEQHTVKKNRRKNPQTEYQGHPNTRKYEEKNNDGDPEDNCILS